MTNGLPNITKRLTQRINKDLMTLGYTKVNISTFLKGKSFKGKSFKTPRWLWDLEDWQKALLNKALPKEGPFCSFIDMRQEADDTLNEPDCTEEEYRNGKTEEECTSIADPHTDGGYLRSLCPFRGEGTFIKHLGKHFQIKRGELFFITASMRTKKTKVKSTVHYRPHTNKPRKLIVMDILLKQ